MTSLLARARSSAERQLRRIARPARLGTLRRTTPLSEAWGYDRGTPVDRYYIDEFLGGHRADVRGHVLEVRDTRYADRFGEPGTTVDVLDIDAENPKATLVCDLAAADSIASETFDCFILTQTLQYIPDLRAALRHARRVLKPGGVLLAVVPGVQRSDPNHLEDDLWRFTVGSCRRLFRDAFGDASVEPYGNVLTCVAALNGMAAQELSPRELATKDPTYPVIIGVRAVR